MSRPFDETFASDVAAVVENIPAHANPRWGRMTKQDLVGHLLAALRFSILDHGADIPPQVAPWRGRLLRFLFLDLGFPMPRNVEFRDRDGTALPLQKSDGSMADLKEVLLRVARATEREVPKTPPHPYFGEMTISLWKKMHVRHIEHHLRQFGIPL